MDCSADLQERVLVQRKVNSYELCGNLFYEFVPHYCHHCGTLGHKVESRKRMGGTRQQGNMETSRPRWPTEKNVQTGMVSNGETEA